VLKVMSRVHTRLYRLSGGRIGKTFRLGRSATKPAPVCLLTTTGRKSGQPRTVPLIYVRDGDAIVVIASRGGSPTQPVWYGNLAVHPEVEIEIGRDRRAYRARTAEGDERDRLWAKAVDVYADYADYQTHTTRQIPVVVCEPLS
jgi:deazaflavin-dependent oxidoreductase (nitroreductase family)